MILAVSAGNTSTRLTWLAHGRVRARRQLATERLSPARLLPLLRRYPFDQAALASVVSSATPVLVEALGSPLVVGPHTRTPLQFRYRRVQLGADRVCAAVGAWERFRRDLVVVDLGTAITTSVVHAPGVFVGGAILPGPALMTQALAAVRARLPLVRAGRAPVIGRSTQTAIRAGTFHLLAGGVEHILRETDQLTGRRHLVVATGGGSASALGRLDRIDAVDQDLVAVGLARLLDLNRRPG